MKNISIQIFLLALLIPSMGFAAGEDGSNVAVGLGTLSNHVGSGLRQVAIAIAAAGAFIAIGLYRGLSKRSDIQTRR